MRLRPRPSHANTPWLRRSCQRVNNALAVQTFGPSFEGQATASKITTWLSEKGYAAHQQSHAGVGEMRTLLKERQHGFFYINSHGGTAELRRQGSHEYLYSVQTSTVVNALFDETPEIEEDVVAIRLAYHTGANGDVGIFDGKPKYDTRYGMTTEFVKKYWNFAPNSIVIINACDSASARYFFAPACHAVNAGVVLGWTGTSAGSLGNSSAYRAPQFFVDRMLGANHAEPKETHPQRAFGWADVMADMQKKGLDVGAAAPTKFVALPKPGGAVQTLAPSIEYLEVDEYNAKLTLHGSFGSVPGTVYVDKFPLALQGAWAADKLVCQLPATGPGSMGAAEVKVIDPSGDKRQSNLRHITEWKLKLKYSHTMFGMPQLVVDGTGTIRFRADVGRRRQRIGETPTFPLCHAHAAADSSLILNAHGKVASGGGSITWMGNATFPGIVAPTESRGLLAYLKVQTAANNPEGSLGLQLQERDSPLISRVCAPEGCKDLPIGASIGTTGLEQGPMPFANPLPGGPDVLLNALKIHFDKNYAIAAGAFPSAQHPEWKAEELFVKLSWDAVLPDSPPQDDDEL